MDARGEPGDLCQKIMEARNEHNFRACITSILDHFNANVLMITFHSIEHASVQLQLLLIFVTFGVWSVRPSLYL